MVKASKFEINKDNIRELEFIELVNNRKHSDYDEKTTLDILKKIYHNSNCNETKIRELMQYYGGQVNKGLRESLNYIMNEKE